AADERWRVGAMTESQRSKGKSQRAKVNRTEAPPLDDRLLDYGARIIRLVEALPKTNTAGRIGDQLLRSGTSAGANYEDDRAGESREDFVHKLQIALKELRESNYWLRLLVRSKLLSVERLGPLIDESDQLKAILSKAVATTKGKAKAQGV